MLLNHLNTFLVLHVFGLKTDTSVHLRFLHVIKLSFEMKKDFFKLMDNSVIAKQ